MMKLIIMIIFLIPLINYWWMLMLNMMLIIMFMLMLPLTTNYSSLSYSFGMDVVSYCMIMLTVWIILLMILASSKIKFMMNSNNEFLLLLILLFLILILAFSTSNMFLFYIFFESSLIPTLFLIFGWGYQPERLLAGSYLLFYTLFASLPLLLGIFYIYYNYMTLYYFQIYLMDFNFYLYVSMIMAFLVKMPMLFMHFWLPKAHVEAPVSGSMILAGVLLKLGGYGLFRVFYFMNKFIYYNYIWLLLSLLGSVLVGLLCMSQVDIKSLIAYSSVSHMGLVICGIMTMNYYGLSGSLIMMIGHGLCSSGMFALANIIYERSHSRSLYINSGLITFMPSVTLFWFMLSCNNMASPPSLNMLGEIMIINSIMSWGSLSFLFLMISSFLSCCYSIYLYSMTQHGKYYSGNIYITYGSVREFLLLFLHWLPLNFLVLKVNLFTLWL